MDWEPPSFAEVKMDSEINSYQDDFRDGPDANESSKARRVITTRQEQRLRKNTVDANNMNGIVVRC